MKSRNIRNRIETLEEQFARSNREVVLYFADGKTSHLYASSTRFFRIVNSLMGNQAHFEHAISDKYSVEDLQRSVRIEGHNNQLFYLLRALALGPAEDNAPMTVRIPGA